MKIITSIDAQKDITNIYEYISKDNKNAALKLIQTFYKKFELILKYPKIGVERKDLTKNKVRFYIVKKRYLVVYALEKDCIQIIRVLEAYQDICNLF